MSRPGAQSGYYWVQAHNGSAVNVYCEMSTNKKKGKGVYEYKTDHDWTSTSLLLNHGWVH